MVFKHKTKEFFSFNSVLPIMFTLDVQIRDVTFGDSANFICCANSTDVTLHWEIQQMENNYCDCSDQAFCVRNTSEVNSTCSTLEIDTTQLNRTDTVVRCVLEQTLGGQTNRNISTGQLTVRNVPRKMFHIQSPTMHTYHMLASYPGSRWAGERESLVSTVCTCA